MSNLSYIEDYEISAAKKLIQEKLGFPPPRVAGYHLAIMIYLVEAMKNEYTQLRDAGFAVPDIIAKKNKDSHKNQKYTSCVGLVVSKGPDCYKGPRFDHSGHWCNIGDWVVFPRHEGNIIDYKDMPFMIIPDDRILLVVDEPADVNKA